MRNIRALTIINALRSLSDFDLDAVRKALQEEGERRGRTWALRQGGSGFGRRQA
jgi:hypothetical protein